MPVAWNPWQPSLTLKLTSVSLIQIETKPLSVIERLNHNESSAFG